MSIIDAKVNRILETLVKSNLQNGNYITSSELSDQLSLLVSETSVEDKSFNAKDSIVSDKEVSSSLKYNNTMSLIFTDLDDIYNAILLSAEERALNFERWKLRLIELSRRTDMLKSSLNGLLLLKKDTAGYFDTIEEFFHDANNTDLIATTADINLDLHTVSVSVDESVSEKVNLNSLFDQNVKFNVITRTGLVNYGSLPGAKPINAFRDESKVWQHSVYMSGYSTPVDVELKIKLTDEDSINISRVEFIPHSSDNSSNMVVKALYSLDDYNWFDFSAVSNPQTIILSGLFEFEPVNVKYVKFIITKDSYDHKEGTKYVYEFGAKNISFYNRAYASSDSEFISENLFVLEDPIDPLSQKKKFNIISCEVCEMIPDGTDIEYFVSSDNMVTWKPITPINRAESQYPKVLVLGTEDDVKSQKNIKLDLSDYTYKNASDRLLNYSINITASDVPYKYIKVWRDIGQKDDTILTNNTVTGWSFDGTSYSTYIEVENANGIYIELGDTYAEIDGSIATGTTFVSSGTHKFKTNKLNWAKLDQAANPLTEEEFRNEDKLYPYNHKLLVEGFNYDVSFDGTQVYTGTDTYASQIMTYVSLFDFNNNVLNSDYSKFSIINDGSTIKILVKYNNNLSDFYNESFYITNRSIVKSVEDIRFRAKLTTSNSSISPVFTGYRIKIGN